MDKGLYKCKSCDQYFDENYGDVICLYCGSPIKKVIVPKMVVRKMNDEFGIDELE
jgi:DNA-directed RNA polymerase subunit RPC12/RpoP